MNGTVKWFDKIKGYGFIAGDYGKEVFAHQSNILMNGFRCLEPEQVVSYEVEHTDRGEKAINITVEDMP